ncbi:unnamed protein product [Vitrella brassicaformis CCMP3155]|uniref:Uncharacterized protein n=1 Tax=Vitrella brassicaformis (strain CCMP3155) TaxID=1169540 RepID=A0A0G4GE32_VITBC|nr:unnamed protein product [Vitrella brassicaformis CCMP3155]|eukprot:CEM27658.1 unnamed protein product [Vitrella brassicaformis CCMP3155]
MQRAHAFARRANLRAIDPQAIASFQSTLRLFVAAHIKCTILRQQCQRQQLTGRQQEPSLTAGVAERVTAASGASASPSARPAERGSGSMSPSTKTDRLPGHSKTAQVELRMATGETSKGFVDIRDKPVTYEEAGDSWCDKIA